MRAMMLRSHCDFYPAGLECERSSLIQLHSLGKHHLIVCTRNKLPSVEYHLILKTCTMERSGSIVNLRTDFERRWFPAARRLALLCAPIEKRDPHSGVPVQHRPKPMAILILEIHCLSLSWNLKRLTLWSSSFPDPSQNTALNRMSCAISFHESTCFTSEIL